MGRISMPQGKGSQLHNRREYKKIGKEIPDNIDGLRTSENIILIDKDIKQAYQEIFGEALEEYNSKQQRVDRKIEDYYEHIKKSKNGEKLFYEDVVQWGSKDDFQDPGTRERAKEALVQYAEGFEQRNSNLKLIGAYIHMDEASPHLHLDYIPVAHGYNRGLLIRNSLNRAMKEMGYIPKSESRKNNATKLWKENERLVFGKICRSFGLEVEVEYKSERMNLTVDEYKKARGNMLEEIEQEKKLITAEVEPLRKLKTDIDEIDTFGTKLPFGIVAIKEKNLEAVKRQAKAYIVNRNEISMLRKRSAAISQREQRADWREQQIGNKTYELEKQEQQLCQMYQRQLNLNQLLGQSERDNIVKNKKIVGLQTENASLKGQIGSLTAQLDEINRELYGMINNYREKLRGAYKSIADIVKAVGMLKYDKKDGYKIEGLTNKQEKLIDGLAEYGAKSAMEDNFPEIADNMKKYIGISKGIGEIIEPSIQKCSKSLEMEL